MWYIRNTAQKCMWMNREQRSISSFITSLQTEIRSGNSWTETTNVTSPTCLVRLYTVWRKSPLALEDLHVVCIVTWLSCHPVISTTNTSLIFFQVQMSIRMLCVLSSDSSNNKIELGCPPQRSPESSITSHLRALCYKLKVLKPRSLLEETLCLKFELNSHREQN